MTPAPSAATYVSRPAAGVTGLALAMAPARSATSAPPAWAAATGQSVPRPPPDCWPPGDGPTLMTATAARHSTAPAYMEGVSRSPMTSAAATGTTVEVTAETGATTTIGPAASPA